MLGHSQVGKTTYMASMYGKLQAPINGFTLGTDDKENHERLIKLHSHINKGEYPDATDQRDRYDFYLKYNDKPIFEFRWTDYRGKAIRQFSDTPEARSLIDDIRDADAIIIFCDADAIRRGKSQTNEIGRITLLVTKAIDQGKRLLPIVIAYTKTDLVGSIDEKLRRPVTSLVTSIRSNNNLRGAFIPIACGRHPRNVELPLLFALHKGLTSYRDSLQAEADYHKSRRQKYIDQGNTFWGFVGDLFNSLIGEPTNEDMAVRERRSMEHKITQVNSVSAPAQELGKYLNGIETF